MSVRRLLAVISVLALALAACTSGGQTTTSAPASTQGGSSDTTMNEPTTDSTQATETTTSGEPAEPTSDSVTIAREGAVFPVFHPVRAQDNTYPILYMVYSNLVRVNADQEIIPDLAESWTVSDDATVFEFDLRDDVTWHDGTPFTANDVVFTAQWGAQNDEAHQGFNIAWPLIAGADETAASGAELEGIEAIDDYTVRITLASPNVEFLRDLADAQNVIVAEHVLADADGSTIEQNPAVTDNPIGTGAYTFVQYRAAEFVELQANPDYYAGAPNINRVFWKDLPVDQIVTQLETGDLDVGFKLDPINRDRLEAVEGLQVLESLEWGMNGLYLRVNHPSLSDRRVRQAFYHAIDRRAILESVLGGNGEVLWNVPGMNFDGLNEYPFDPDRARELLSEAGFTQDAPLKLVYWQDMPHASAMTPIFQQQLADVGVEVELLPLEIDEWDDRVLNPDRKDEWEIDLEFGGNYGRNPNASARQYEMCGEQMSHNMYQNCELADLYAQGRSTADPAERERIYREAAAIINEEVDVLWLWQPLVIHGVSSRVGGVEVHPFDRDSVMNIHEWTVSG